MAIFWQDVKKLYPALSFFHCHGLGILNVGSENNSLTEVFRLIESNPDYWTFSQQFFEAMGELAVEHRTLVEEVKSNIAAIAEKDTKLTEFQAYLAHRDSQLREADQVLADRNVKLTEFQNYLAHRNSQLLEAKQEIADRDAELIGIRARLAQREDDLLLCAWQHNFMQSNHPKRCQQDGKIIEQSGLFDRNYYVAANEDVFKSKMDPLMHFVHHGVHKLRNPSPSFNTARYLIANRDVLEANINPFVHYIVHGRKEGRAL